MQVKARFRNQIHPALTNATPSFECGSGSIETTDVVGNNPKIRLSSILNRDFRHSDVQQSTILTSKFKLHFLY